MSELVLVNPRRKKRRKTTRRKSARRNPSTKRKVTRRRSVARKAPTRRRRVRRNPKLSVKSIMRDTLVPSAVGAGGALALDVSFGMLPIPATFKSGPVGSLAKIAGAIVLGKIAGKALGSRRGEQVTAGAVTVLAYDMIKKGLQQYVPGLPLSEYVGMDGSDFAYNPYPSLGYMNAGQAVEAAPNVALDEYIPSDGMGEMDYYS